MSCRTSGKRGYMPLIPVEEQVSELGRVGGNLIKAAEPCLDFSNALAEVKNSDVTKG